MLSRRTAWETHPSALARALARARSKGENVLDLTISNPTTVGLTYSDAFYRTLVDERCATYEPAATGLPDARAAVADYYRRRGVSADPDCLWLCASTSEAYAHLLAILCDPGDAVLVPRPGYPLLQYLADIAGVRLVPYDLRYDGHWHIELDALERTMTDTERLRVVIAVNPGNPTGHYLDEKALIALEDGCTRRGCALVVDEVFADYPLHRRPGHVAHLLGERPCLCFVLSGLSKVAALPQLKLSWTAVCGPGDFVSHALARIEVVADTFLSASTPIQLALPRLLRAADDMQERIRSRTRNNLDTLRARLAGSPCDVLDVEGGWTALVRVPAVADLDDLGWAMRLLEYEHTLVQPGYLFDLDDPPHLAVSLLCEPQTIERGVAALRRAVERTCA
jgi:aspartate/methionine/tyrosine aminotransferase